MRLLKPFATILNVSHDLPSSAVDSYGRTCYKSEGSSLDPADWRKFIAKRLEDGHESIIEHVTATVKFICDRGVSHELVRHRLASFSQESTRYCNYHIKGMTFIIPPWTNLQECEYDSQQGVLLEGEYDSQQGVLFYDEQEMRWLAAMAYAENFYNELLASGWKPQQARSVLPNSLKTELVMTTNLREWRHIFSLRCDTPSHPQMREIMLPLLKDFYNAMPDFFEDLYIRFFGGNSECNKKESSGLA